MFSEILSSLGDTTNAGDHLLGLTKVPRISTLTMFMSTQDRAKVGDMIKADKSKSLNAEQREKVRKVFELL